MKPVFLLLVLLFAAPAQAQTKAPAPRDPAIERCKQNRGVDCDTPEGLREWLRQERPITPEAQSAAAGARKHREQCAKNPKGGGC